MTTQHYTKLGRQTVMRRRVSIRVTQIYAKARLKNVANEIWALLTKMRPRVKMVGL